jgi:hypothetical protein
LIAHLILVGGQEVIGADDEYGSSGDSQSAGEQLTLWSGLLRRFGVPGGAFRWILACAVVRIGWPIGVLRGVGGLGWGMILLRSGLWLVLRLVLLLRLLSAGPGTEAQGQSCCPCGA